jgi:hypothetical protein
MVGGQEFARLQVMAANIRGEPPDQLGIDRTRPEQPAMLDEMGEVVALRRGDFAGVVEPADPLHRIGRVGPQRFHIQPVAWRCPHDRFTRCVGEGIDAQPTLFKHDDTVGRHWSNGQLLRRLRMTPCAAWLILDP